IQGIGCCTQESRRYKTNSFNPFGSISLLKSNSLNETCRMKSNRSDLKFPLFFGFSGIKVTDSQTVLDFRSKHNN
ncbi:MAG: hypothetical protein M3Z49_13990, partial [Bifidobacteriales bacterium]|nr:hypothetical protein [Bifidobacteriales bacterium]